MAVTPEVVTPSVPAIFKACVSVTQHLTFHVIIRATNDTNLLAADEGQKF